MWLLVAILSPIFFSALTPFDSALRRRFVSDDFALVFGAMVARLVFCVLMYVFLPISLGWSWLSLGAFLSGVFTVVPLYLYYRSLNVEKGTVVTMLMQTIPVFALFIAYIALGEVLTMAQALAFCLILVGGVLSAVHKLDEVWAFSKVFWIMLLACVFWASSDVLFKFSEQGIGVYWQAFWFYYLGSACFVLPVLIFGKWRRKFVSHYYNVGARFWVIFGVSNLLAFAGYAVLGFALSLGKASLTTVMYGLMPLLTFGFSHLFSKMMSEISADRFSKSEIWLKVAAFILMSLGLYFLI